MRHIDHSRDILVTGSPRSGTTFVGKMLSLPREVGYIPEPLNQAFGVKGIDRDFQYIEASMPEEARYHNLVENLLDGNAKFRRLSVSKGEPAKENLHRAVFKSRNNYDYLRAVHDPSVKRFLIRDPMSCLASEYMHRNFGVQVVLLVRHPAAYVTSAERLDFVDVLDKLTSQQPLMKRHLDGIFAATKTDALSPTEKHALMWNCLYTVLLNFAEDNPDFIVMTHEEISADPQAKFEELYRQLGLQYTPQISQTIAEHTGAHNPVDPTNNQQHVLKRNSRDNAYRWKKILSPDQVAAIKGITNTVASNYYDDASWGYA